MRIYCLAFSTCQYSLLYSRLSNLHVSVAGQILSFFKPSVAICSRYCCNISVKLSVLWQRCGLGDSNEWHQVKKDWFPFLSVPMMAIPKQSSTSALLSSWCEIQHHLVYTSPKCIWWSNNQKPLFTFPEIWRSAKFPVLILFCITTVTIYPSYRHKPTMEDAVVSQKMAAILWASMLVHLPVAHDGIQEGWRAEYL